MPSREKVRLQVLEARHGGPAHVSRRTLLMGGSALLGIACVTGAIMFTRWKRFGDKQLLSAQSNPTLAEVTDASAVVVANAPSADERARKVCSLDGWCARFPEFPTGSLFAAHGTSERSRSVGTHTS